MNDDLMRNAGFGREVNRKNAGYCPLCTKPINMEDFKDALSKKEFTISGMCQTCQDSIFS